MKKKIKIYTREYYDNKTKQTWYFQKGLTLNVNENKVVYGNIKWFIKKEIVEKLLGEKMGGVFEATISKVLTSDFITKNGEKLKQHTFEIVDLQPLKDNDDFDKKLSTILEKSNQEYMEQVFE